MNRYEVSFCCESHLSYGLHWLLDWILISLGLNTVSPCQMVMQWHRAPRHRRAQLGVRMKQGKLSFKRVMQGRLCILGLVALALIRVVLSMAIERTGNQSKLFEIFSSLSTPS